MSGYGAFAKYYDSLTSDIDYDGRARFFDTILKKHHKDPKLVLDLACGTGSLSVALSRLGYEVIGVDASVEMLMEAARKNAEHKTGILFLNQSMGELDLYGTVDASICALDSVNHIPDEKSLLDAFKRTALFTNSGGVFIFDVNTRYKHSDVLGDNAFVYERPDVFCVWQNSFDPETARVDVALDFFAPDKTGAYYRESESFSEYFYSDGVLRQIAEKAGFEHLETLADDGFEPVSDDTQRLIYIFKRKCDPNG